MDFSDNATNPELRVVSALVLNGMLREQTVELFVSQRHYWVEPNRSPRRDVVST